MPRRFATSNRLSARSLFMFRSTFKLVTKHHLSNSRWVSCFPISTHTVDGLQPTQTRDGLSWNSCVFQLSVTTTSNVSRLEIHAPIATLRISLGYGLRECHKFSRVGTPSTFKRPSCTACSSHKKRTSTCRVVSVAKKTWLLPRCCRNACESRTSLLNANQHSFDFECMG